MLEIITPRPTQIIPSETPFPIVDTEEFKSFFNEICCLSTYWFAAYFPIYYFCAIVFPFIFVIDCVDGHRYLSHILITIVALCMTSMDIYILYNFMEKEVKLNPEYAKYRRTTFLHILKSEGRTLTAMADLYTDFCFISILWYAEMGTAIVGIFFITVASWPKIVNLFKILCCSRPCGKALDDKWLFFALLFKAFEMFGFDTYYNHLILSSLYAPIINYTNFEVSKLYRLIYVVQKVFLEDLLQLILQFVFIMNYSQFCPDGEDSGVNPIIFVSMAVSILQGIWSICAAYKEATSAFYTTTTPIHA